MHQCGFPPDVIQLVISQGKPAGQQLVPDARVKGVLFTGSTQAGHWLNEALAERPEVEVPLIAETGGQNVMIVDSTALPEQVVDDVVVSGFLSAGQRCSALRVLFLQAEIVETVTEMLIGAMMELSIGNPGLLSTDIGPVIDNRALEKLHEHCRYLDSIEDHAELIYKCELTDNVIQGHFFAPHLYEIDDLHILKEEVFGPVVHIIRYEAHELDQIVDQINALGYGLTLGIHSRIHAMADKTAARAKVGNVYVNRSMIGAVVGVQPFGGRGLSGTGPKAGGPRYLKQLVTGSGTSSLEQTGPIGDLQAILANGAKGRTRHSSPLGQSKMAHQLWVDIGFAERMSVLRGIVPPAGDSKQRSGDEFDRYFSLADRILAEPMELPGPTGEDNRLIMESRGVIAVLTNGDFNTTRAIRQVMAVLMTGNALVFVVGNVIQAALAPLLDLCNQAGIPKNLISVTSDAVAVNVLTSPDLDGVMVSSDSTTLKLVQKTLAKRKDAIIPLIRWRDQLADDKFDQNAMDEDLFDSLLVEKTVTIDTTAAGGNASLMTASD
jgi:RHH-type proline utilization regulon transcriptional repressor/proline dehydrogenase/delta 1-pyrroline-5-carboxylate dehydrogenase